MQNSSPNTAKHSLSARGPHPLGTRRCFRYVAALLLLCLGAPLRMPSCCAQRGGNPRIEIASIDAQTRWAFRSLSPVTVSSQIIRLGDVVQPLDPNMAGWQRLRRSPIGLVPIGGHPMTIERDRLADAIRTAEATPRAIDWVGPATIQVVYRESAPSFTRDPPPQIARSGDLDSPLRADIASPLSTPEAERILRWVYLAVDRQHPSVSEIYSIEIDPKQPRLGRLGAIAGVTSIEFRDQVREGLRRVHVVARSVDGPVESDLDVVLRLHPTVAVPRKGLPRGHRIEAGDLIAKPIANEEIEPDFVIEPSEVIGLEVRDALRANHPIDRSDLGAPILVHRGDLIEIRVLGGGITITTNAKSLGNGAASDLVEVETMQPRKRLLARVVQPGLVEIVTRAPRVKP